ncbi:MAG: hypothetical protein OEM04_09300, partial [Flavobacteriaceae bacterium]|nr:hypothetical protein [Flavobacteriaceae bacterium]
MKTDNQTYFLQFIVALIFLSSCLAFSQTTTPFAKRYETTGINGDLTIIGNSILGDSKDTPYNGTTQNNYIDMVFVDIDNNVNTF